MEPHLEFKIKVRVYHRFDVGAFKAKKMGYFEKTVHYW